MKTRYELDEFDTTEKHIVDILVYAALLTLITSRTPLNLVTAAVRADGRRRSENPSGTTDPPRATRYCHATGEAVLAKDEWRQGFSRVEDVNDAERTAACDLIESTADESGDEFGAPVDVVIERIRMSSDFTLVSTKLWTARKNHDEAYELEGYLRSI